MYSDLVRLNAQHIIAYAAPFAASNNQTEANLRHLLTDQVVGQWRDSTYGIGGGRVSLDVNTALVPAALHAIASLSAAGVLGDQAKIWGSTAETYAQVWEDNTLHFFAVTEPVESASSLVASYAASNFTGPSGVEDITGPVTYYALALDGNNKQQVVKVMNSDICFRLFLLNSTQNDELTVLMNSTANNIQAQFPVGLSTDTGMLVSNPAYGGDPVYGMNWTTSAYHGTVIWSWPMAMMAKGLERQIARCDVSSPAGSSSVMRDDACPAWCSDSQVYANVRSAYNHLWDLVEANDPHLETEVWSWDYGNGTFNFLDFGVLSATGAY